MRIASAEDDSEATSLAAALVEPAPWCRTVPNALLVDTEPLHSRSVTDALLLTGDDLTVQDVWDVAVGRRAVALADERRGANDAIARRSSTISVASTRTA